MELKRDQIGAVPLEYIGEIHIPLKDLKITKDDVDLTELLRKECQKRMENLTEDQRKALKRIAEAHVFDRISEGFSEQDANTITSELLQESTILEKTLEGIEEEVIAKNQDQIFVTPESFEEQSTKHKEYKKFSNAYQLLKLETESLKSHSDTIEIKERIDALEENITELEEEMGATRSYYREEGYEEAKQIKQEELENDLFGQKEDIAAQILYPEYYQTDLRKEIVAETLLD